MQDRNPLTVADVDEVYRKRLLGPSGQSDLMHYETRLKDGLDGEQSFRIAMEILADTAIKEVFTPGARRCLERIYATLTDDAPARVADVLEVLVHDGYLEADDDGCYRFPSHLLKEWLSVRYRGHHTPIESRCSDRQLRDGGR